MKMTLTSVQADHWHSRRLENPKVDPKQPERQHSRFIFLKQQKLELFFFFFF